MITIYDSDAIIKMGNPLPDGTSHLTRVMATKGMNYLHTIVNQEITRPPARQHLDTLLANGSFIEYHDADLFDLYKQQLMITSGIDEQMADELTCQQYRLFLSEKIDLTEERAYLRWHYQSVLNDPITTLNSYLTVIRSLDQAILGSQKGVGELKTAAMIDMLYAAGIQQINLYLSDDGQARSMVEASACAVQPVSVLGTFVLLYQQNCPRQEASRYFNQFMRQFQTIKKTEIKRHGEDDWHRNVTYDQIFEYIFEGRIRIGSAGTLEYM